MSAQKGTEVTSLLVTSKVGAVLLPRGGFGSLFSVKRIINLNILIKSLSNQRSERGLTYIQVAVTAPFHLTQDMHKEITVSTKQI